jgi:hypothetical protein
MSLTADYDFVFELSRNVLLKLIQANGSLRGTPLAPPFEFGLPAPIGGVQADTHFIIKDLSLSLIARTDNLILTLPFEDSSVITDALALTPLEGELTIQAQVQVVDSKVNQRSVTLNLQGATGRLLLNQPSRDRVAAQFRGAALPLTVADFETQAGAAFTSFVRGQSNPILQTFNVVPGRDGTLAPSLQLERFDKVFNINDQTMALFGIFLASRHGAGNASLKTQTAMRGGDDVALSISPEAFRRIIFCRTMAIRNLQRRLIDEIREANPGLTPDQVSARARDEAAARIQANPALIASLTPSACGSEGSVEEEHGVKVTSLVDTFVEGGIDINGTFEKSDDCYEASGDFHQRMSMEIVNGRMNPILTPNPPTVNVDVDVDFWCKVGALLLGSFVYGPIGIFLAGVTIAVGEHIGEVIAEGAVPPRPSNPINFPTFRNVTFTNPVRISPEGLTLGGQMRIFAPISAFSRRIDISGSVSTLTSRTLSQGVYHYEGNSTCPPGDFDYTEMAQEQSGVYIARPELLGRPLKFEWTLETHRGFYLSHQKPELVGRVVLTEPSGTIELPADVSYPFPLPGGTTLQGEKVKIRYQISGNQNRVLNDQITLWNVPPYNNYTLTLRVKAVWPQGKEMESSLGDSFEGDKIVLEPDYLAHMMRCQLTVIKLKAKTGPILESPSRPGREPDPRTLELVNILSSVLISGRLDSMKVLSDLRLQYGESVNRTLFLPGAMIDILK